MWAALAAVLLLFLFACGATVWIGNRYVGYAYEHVVIEVSNVAGIARTDVNCRRARSIEAGEDPKRVDLGWLRPRERIYLCEYSERGPPAWDFEVIVDDKVVDDFSRDTQA